ncbi:hypothetical protein H0H87_010596 [Tephrocybe sp. NHM501043]|nr:hypothetical protein H0H87_007705 [Tephrocybe sp. NHM501043]KAG6852203.1 hypothetical protein H0H87_010596 [Tephrocybe sp. NHM501043]
MDERFDTIQDVITSHAKVGENWSDDGDNPEEDDDTYDDGNKEHGSEGKSVSHDASAEPEEPDVRGDMFKASITPSSPHINPNPEVDEVRPLEEE